MRTLVLGASMASLLLSGCGLFEPSNCTLIGCNDGIVIQLGALPPCPYRVEVMLEGPNQTPVWTLDCATACGSAVQYPGTPARVWVRVITSTGQTTTEFANVEYRSVRPNGDGCPPVCQQAVVTMNLPAAAPAPANSRG